MQSFNLTKFIYSYPNVLHCGVIYSLRFLLLLFLSLLKEKVPCKRVSELDSEFFRSFIHVLRHLAACRTKYKI